MPTLLHLFLLSSNHFLLPSVLSSFRRSFLSSFLPSTHASTQPSTVPSFLLSFSPSICSCPHSLFRRSLALRPYYLCNIPNYLFNTGLMSCEHSGQVVYAGWVYGSDRDTLCLSVDTSKKRDRINSERDSSSLVGKPSVGWPVAGGSCKALWSFMRCERFLGSDQRATLRSRRRPVFRLARLMWDSSSIQCATVCCGFLSH